jgi:hypothetical protein
MMEVKRLFDTGNAIPLSDVGLVSTQEDVIRQPMLNHIAAFSNSVVPAYLLVQRTASGKGWSYATSSSKPSQKKFSISVRSDIFRICRP